MNTDNDNLKYGIATLFKQNKEMYDNMNNNYKDFSIKVIMIIGICLVFALIIIGVIVFSNNNKRIDSILSNNYANYPPEILHMMYMYKAYQQQQFNIMNGQYAPIMQNMQNTPIMQNKQIDIQNINEDNKTLDVK